MVRIVLLIFFLIGFYTIRIYWRRSDPRPTKEAKQFWRTPKMFLFTRIEDIVAIILIITTIFFPLPKTALDNFLIAIGLILYLSGFVLLIWAKKVMGRSWVAEGIKHNAKRQQNLVTTGPFAFTRNPIYLGFWLLPIGMLLALKSPLIVLMIYPIVHYYKAIHKEEKFLEELFGEEYRAYKKRTPRII